MDATMITFLYNIIIHIILFLISPYLLFKYLKDPNFITERLGNYEKVKGKSIWLHAASMGEAGAAEVLIEKLRAELPDYKIIMAVNTKSGKERVQKFTHKPDKVYYAPFDCPFIISKAIKKLNPQYFVSIEAEFWLNLLRLMEKNTSEIYLVNGRVSPHTFKYIKYFTLYYEYCLDQYQGLLMKSKSDARRIKRLGANSEKVSVIGDLKLSSKTTEHKATLDLHFPQNKTIVTFGSTRPGEEEIIIKALDDLTEQIFPIIAPRHVDRIEELESLLKNTDIQHIRRSECEDVGENDLLLLDTIGELVEFYKISDIAFVGGSLIDYGGHNPVEPASVGTPVLFGPYMSTPEFSSSLLLKNDGAIQVEDGKDLKRELQHLLSDKSRLKQMGTNCKKTVAEMGHIVDDYVEEIVT